jgi:hypothetical protein
VQQLLKKIPQISIIEKSNDTGEEVDKLIFNDVRPV